MPAPVPIFLSFVQEYHRQQRELEIAELAEQYRPVIILDFHRVIQLQEHGRVYIPRLNYLIVSRLVRLFEVHIVSYGSESRNRETRHTLQNHGFLDLVDHSSRHPKLHFVYRREHKADYVRRLRAQAIVDDNKEVIEAVEALNRQPGALRCVTLGINTPHHTFYGGFENLQHASECYLEDRHDTLCREWAEWKLASYMPGRR